MLDFIDFFTYSYVKKTNEDCWSEDVKTHAEFHIECGKTVLQNFAKELLKGEDKAVSFNRNSMDIEYDILTPDTSSAVCAYEDIHRCNANNLTKDWYLEVDLEKSYQLLTIEGTISRNRLTKINCTGDELIQRLTKELDEEQTTVSDIVITDTNNLRIHYNHNMSYFKEFNIIEL